MTYDISEQVNIDILNRILESIIEDTIMNMNEHLNMVFSPEIATLVTQIVLS